MPELVSNLQAKLLNVPREKRALVLDILQTATPEDIIEKVELRRSQMIAAAKLEDLSPEKKMERMHEQASPFRTTATPSQPRGTHPNPSNEPSWHPTLVWCAGEQAQETAP